MKTEHKSILEPYIRKVDRLVHLIISGEEIITTVDHPFYVQGRGFIEAGNLLVNDKLVSAKSEDLTIEDYHIELTEEPVLVYNFQVEDFHTYHVGKNSVLVHNADYNIAKSNSVRKVDSTKKVNDAHDMPIESEPNSVIQNYKKGNLTTERYYGEDGKAYLDIDYTNHGNPKMHPNVPHEHNISFESGHFTREKVGRMINK